MFGQGSRILRKLRMTCTSYRSIGWARSAARHYWDSGRVGQPALGSALLCARRTVKHGFHILARNAASLAYLVRSHVRPNVLPQRGERFFSAASRLQVPAAPR